MNFTHQTIHELRERHRQRQDWKQCEACHAVWPCAVARLAEDWEALYGVLQGELIKGYGVRRVLQKHGLSAALYRDIQKVVGTELQGNEWHLPAITLTFGGEPERE